MNRVASLFALAILLPSLVLAGLAVRSLRDTEVVLERQQALIQQTLADSLSQGLGTFLSEVQRSFRLQVELGLLGNDPHLLAHDFHANLRTNWPWTEVGFAVSLQGAILSPSAQEDLTSRQFLQQNNLFLSNRETVQAYLNVKDLDYTQAGAAQQKISIPPLPNARARQQSSLQTESPAAQPPVPDQGQQQAFRNVIPSQAVQTTTLNTSRLEVSQGAFQQLVRESTEGSLARFLQDQLHLLMWYRPPRETNLVFGVQINLEKLKESLGADLAEQLDQRGYPNDVCIALLDDRAHPVYRSEPAFETDWKHPFVATELGETLPHWELAVYLLDPSLLPETAHTMRVTLGGLILVLVFAIATGAWLIVRELRQQLVLARQKTDFVSNVSHELKTPLTSIRMFAELLAEDRVSDPKKQRNYLNVITSETARLSRLINNILDFSRAERDTKRYTFEDCDLAELTREACDTCRPHLENHGFSLTCQLPETAILVRADRDALTQVLLNLLSNAEKYSSGNKEIRVELVRKDSPIAHAEIRVLDRGLGVPRGREEAIFQQFYRAHDSLDSGIQGSGLGLTLARMMARAHGGEVHHQHREGGGSIFILTLPTLPSS